MLERYGWRQHSKEAAFNAESQGGDALGDGNSEKEGLQKALAVVGERLTELIDAVDPRELTEEEFAKSRYYRYSLAVSLRGMNREEFLPDNPVHREDELLYLDMGAREAALECLEDFPGSRAALCVGFLGMSAPDREHRLLYHQGIGHTIMWFINFHNPHLES